MEGSGRPESFYFSQFFQLPSPWPRRLSHLSGSCTESELPCPIAHDMSKLPILAPHPTLFQCLLAAQAPSFTEVYLQGDSRGASATPGLAFGEILDSELML